MTACGPGAMSQTCHKLVKVLCLTFGSKYGIMYTQIKERYIQMSKAYEEMKKAEQHISNACGCYNGCAGCPMNFSSGPCVLIQLHEAMNKQQFRDLRAEAYGEVM